MTVADDFRPLPDKPAGAWPYGELLKRLGLS